MSNKSTDALAAQIRRAWIERYAQRHGTITRPIICTACGCSPAQASADIESVLAANPGCLTYDLSAKLYRWTGKRLMQPLPRIIASLNLDPP